MRWSPSCKRERTEGGVTQIGPAVQARARGGGSSGRRLPARRPGSASDQRSSEATLLGFAQLDQARRFPGDQFDVGVGGRSGGILHQPFVKAVDGPREASGTEGGLYARQFPRSDPLGLFSQGQLTLELRAKRSGEGISSIRKSKIIA